MWFWMSRKSWIGTIKISIEIISYKLLDINNQQHYTKFKDYYSSLLIPYN